MVDAAGYCDSHSANSSYISLKSCIFSFSSALCMCPNSTVFQDAERPLDIFNCMVTVHVVKFCCGLFVNAGSTVCRCTCVWSTKISRVISVDHFICHFSSLLHLIIFLLCVTSTISGQTKRLLSFLRNVSGFVLAFQMMTGNVDHLHIFDKVWLDLNELWESIMFTLWNVGGINIIQAVMCLYYFYNTAIQLNKSIKYCACLVHILSQ